MFSQDELDQARAVPVLEIAERHGAKLRRSGKQYEGPCTICGGDDRFWVVPSLNVAGCRGCDCRGDAIGLEMQLSGGSFVDAMRALIGRDAGTTNRRQPTPDEIRAREAREAERRRAEAEEQARNVMRAAKITAGIVPVRGTLAERYLSDQRRIDVEKVLDVLERADAIGFHPAVYLKEPGHPLHGQFLPAIIAIQTDPVTAAPTGGIARTYLDWDGRKLIGLDGKSLRAKGLGPTGVVRLVRDVLEDLHIAEGLETALSAMALGFRPVWAMGSDGTMAAFPVLDRIRRLTILADNDSDKNDAGERAAIQAGLRWRAAGREVRILAPQEPGDINDMVGRAQ
jgi:putative DNA primase/helicase